MLTEVGKIAVRPIYTMYINVDKCISSFQGNVVDKRLEFHKIRRAK